MYENPVSADQLTTAFLEEFYKELGVHGFTPANLAKKLKEFFTWKDVRHIRGSKTTKLPDGSTVTEDCFVKSPPVKNAKVQMDAWDRAAVLRGVDIKGVQKFDMQHHVDGSIMSHVGKLLAERGETCDD